MITTGSVRGECEARQAGQFVAKPRRSPPFQTDRRNSRGFQCTPKIGLATRAQFGLARGEPIITWAFRQKHIRAAKHRVACSLYPPKDPAGADRISCRHPTVTGHRQSAQHVFAPQQIGAEPGNRPVRDDPAANRTRDVRRAGVSTKHLAPPTGIARGHSSAAQCCHGFPLSARNLSGTSIATFRKHRLACFIRYPPMPWYIAYLAKSRRCKAA